MKKIKNKIKNKKQNKKNTENLKDYQHRPHQQLW
jgi:hypothetical protein